MRGEKNFNCENAESQSVIPSTRPPPTSLPIPESSTPIPPIHLPQPPLVLFIIVHHLN